MKTIRVLGLLAAGTLLATGSVLALEAEVINVGGHRSPNGVTEMQRVRPAPENHLPTPVEPEPGPSAMGFINAGDVFGDGRASGAALVQPRSSGSIYTPRQQDDREIQKLIHRLD